MQNFTFLWEFVVKQDYGRLFRLGVFAKLNVLLCITALQLEHQINTVLHTG